MELTTAKGERVPSPRAANGRSLDGEKARRIIDAMRESVAEVGIARSTFDRVSAKAGVSRGLLHYYFGTKERLVIEALRHDSELRIGMLDEPLGRARTVDEVIAALLSGAERLAREDPGYYAILFELFIEARRNPEIRSELGELYDASRHHVAAALSEKQAEGVVSLRFDAETVVSYLFAATDGAILQRFTSPGGDPANVIESAVEVARFLLDARDS